MSFYYLASPYSKHPKGTQAAFERACEATAILLAAGVPVFSPIAHSHSVSEIGHLDGDHGFWMNVDFPYMDAALGLIVLMDEGWEDSKGVTEEIGVFACLHKPIYYMTPGIVPPVLEMVFEKEDEEEQQGENETVDYKSLFYSLIASLTTCENLDEAGEDIKGALSEAGETSEWENLYELRDILNARGVRTLWGDSLDNF